MLRFRSAEAPFGHPQVAGQAARLLAEAEAGGLWEPDRIITSLTEAVFAEALEMLAANDVVPQAQFQMPSYAAKGGADFAAWIRSLREILAASPVPECELPKLDELFGIDRLAELVGVANSSLRRYLNAERSVPDDVAWRIHVVARLVGYLAGSYNDRGTRRWFERPRQQLDGRAPDEILAGIWGPDQSDVMQLLQLAEARSG